LAGALLAAGLNAAHIGMPEMVQWILMSDRLFLSVHADKVVLAIVGLTAATSLAALLPSIFAARLKPVTAMHHIG
ncbi:MAG: ABC transporter permease, partial [Deltaproteobacteria bacterium]|nr:ABC transporter permease [Deltaproteobacteria bacterium]